MQFTRNILKNDEQHIQGITLQRSTSKLYGQFCYTSQDDEEIGRKKDPIFENHRKTQPIFQII